MLLPFPSLSLRDFPWIPIPGIVTNIVAPALFKTGSREEHEPGIVGQRHETVRITRWDKKHCRFGGGKDVPVNLDIPARCLPIINGHGSDDGRALHHSDVLGLLAVCVPRANEAGPVIGNQVETLHALETEVVHERYGAAVVDTDVALRQGGFNGRSEEHTSELQSPMY